MKPRFTILNLMGAVAVAAFVAAIWNAGSEYWAIVAFNLTALALIIASCKARFSSGAAGAWWFGFALFGWAHFVLGLLAAILRPYVKFSLALVTQIPLASPRLTPPDPRFFDPRIIPDIESGIARSLILHDLLSLLVGFIGAWIVWFLAAGGRPSGSSATASRDSRT